LVEEEEEDVKAAREAEEAGEEEDESEDEDFVPNAASEGDESDGDEGEYEDDIPEVSGPAGPAGKRGGGGKKAPAAKKPRKPPGAPRAKPATKRKGKGGAFVESDDEPSFADLKKAPPADDGEAGGGEEESPESPAPAAAVSGAGKASVDDLWASMNAPTARKSSSAGSSNVDDLWASMNASSTVKKAPPKADAVDIKSLLQKTARGAVPSGGEKMVEIQQRMDFCGEEIIVTKRVAVGSKEEEAYRQSGLQRQSSKDIVASSVAQGVALQQEMKRAELLGAPPKPAPVAGLRFSDDLAFKEELPVAKLPGKDSKPTGLQGLLASLDGKKKMSTMEKSKHDWNRFKSSQDDHTLGELKKASQDGYLEKMAFLQRADQRQADVARSNRRRGMGLKD